MKTVEVPQTGHHQEVILSQSLPPAGRPPRSPLCASASLRAIIDKSSATADPQIFCFPKGLSAFFFLIDPRELFFFHADSGEKARRFLI